MKIELNKITIGEISKNYIDNEENGVLGYDGKLNIRPKYQREYVYDAERRNAVVDSVRNNLPINVMYWARNNDGTYEVIDGQQRTISICQYINGDFSIDVDGHAMSFHNLTEAERNQILNYELMIYLCDGTEREKLNWFRTINIAGIVFSEQELRNSVYTGPWLSDAKLKFSKSTCAAYNLASKYVKGSPIRQELLETALDWISDGKIEEYMSKHQHDPNANELWMYFRNVIEWLKLTFPVYRSEMRSVDWHILYNKYKDVMYDTDKLEQEIEKLMIDDEITNKKGIYYYILTRDEKYLNIRTFTESQRREVYERQKGKCNICKKEYDLIDMDADHITPWSKGGKTSIENCQLLCKDCNRRKSNL